MTGYSRGNTLCLILMLLVLVAGVVAEPVSDPDDFFAREQGVIDVAGRGLGGCGAAFAWNLTSVAANPALLYSCRNTTAPRSRTVGLGYGRDSLFNQFIIPAGASYSVKKTALAVNFRALSSTTGLEQYEAGATWCRRLWGLSHPKGPLDAGLNLRYAYARGKNRRLDTLLSTSTGYNGLGVRQTQVSVTGRSIAPGAGDFRANRVALDAGLFKQEFATHTDLGISIINLFGYRWGAKYPDTVTGITRRITDTATNAYIVDTVRSYAANLREYPGGQIDGKNAVLDIGIHFKVPIPGNSFSLSFPFDYQAYGILDPSGTVTHAFRGGMQVHCLENLFVRAGFSRAPAAVADRPGTIRNVNNVTFGASAIIPGVPAVVDLCFYGWEWGMHATVDY